MYNWNDEVEYERMLNEIFTTLHKYNVSYEDLKEYILHALPEGYWDWIDSR